MSEGDQNSQEITLTGSNTSTVANVTTGMYQTLPNNISNCYDTSYIFGNRCHGIHNHSDTELLNAVMSRGLVDPKKFQKLLDEATILKLEAEISYKQKELRKLKEK